MYSINISKLIGKIAEKGYSKKSFARAAGVSVPTFFRYLKEPDNMPYWFIVKCSELLCDTLEEVKLIFFESKLT